MTFLLVFSAMIALSITARIRRAWPGKPALATVAEIPSSDDYYLAYFRGGIEHYMIYRNLAGAADHLKSADVLFLGHSRTLFDFPRETLEPFFRQRGLSYFVMGFTYGEPSAFAAAIIRKYDLHPKWVVINADPFFLPTPTGFARKVMHDSRFDAWKYRLESCGSFYAQRWLHQVVPQLAYTQAPGDCIFFRSRTDGTIRLGASAGPRLAVPDSEWPAPDSAWLVPFARAFKADLTRRGAKMCVTCAPLPSTKSAQTFGEALNVPVILPKVPNLYTIDGSHLEHDSAVRFSQAFLDQFATVLDKSDAPRQQPATAPDPVKRNDPQ